MTLNKRAAMHIETLKSHQQFPMRTAYNSFKCSLMDLSQVYQTLKGIFERNDIKGKNASIGRANKIIIGLRKLWTLKEELSQNLSDLYDYCIRRLLKANIRNDVEGIVEVKGLMNEVRSAWNIVPELPGSEHIGCIL